MDPEPVIICQREVKKKGFKCDKKADVYCSPCKGYYCNDCIERMHETSDTLSEHNDHLIDAVTYHKFASEMRIEANDEEIMENHKQNCLIGYNYDSNQLDFGARFHTIKDDLKNAEWLPLVGFVGPTGVGKSRLIRNFCSGPEKPLPGKKDGCSTSSDIHIYLGDLPICEKNILDIKKIGILDSEGTGGTESYISKLIGSTLARVTPEIYNKKRNLAALSYPRLLYLFCNVLCFVFQGADREKDTIIGRLKEYARVAASRSVNNKLPSLIIIFNKFSKNQGIWDIDEAREIWFKGIDDSDSHQEKSFDKYYNSINVVYLPDALEHPKLFFDQVFKLKSLVYAEIFLSIKSRHESNTLLTQSQLFSSLRKAVDKMDQNPIATINFNEIKPVIVDCSLSAFILKFVQGVQQALLNPPTNKFTKVYHQKPIKSLSEAYLKTTNFLEERLIHILYNYEHENGGTMFNGDKLTDHAKALLTKASEMINEEAPCSSTCKFEGLNDEVFCETTKANHKNEKVTSSGLSETFYQHKSSQTYKGRKPKFFGLIETTISTPCIWPGEYTPKQIDLVSRVEEDLKTFSKEEYKGNLSLIVYSQGFKLAMNRNEPFHSQFYNVCFRCVFQVPTVFLSCSHLICFKCAQRSITSPSTKIVCPICKYETSTTVNIPSKFGYRILSLDGGGVRGIVSLMVLRSIEKATFDTSIYNLFDMIVGTSTGGIISLGILNKIAISELIDLFGDLSSSIFDPFWASKMGRFTQLFWNYKHSPENLQNYLEKMFGSEKKMLQKTYSEHTPLVAVTACKMDSGNPEEVLFRSYNTGTWPNSQPLNPTYNPTFIQAARATSAAPTYLPVYKTDFGNFVDGGLLANNPCYLAWKEAQNQWPESNLNVIVSLGTGEWKDENMQLKHDAFFFMDTIIRCATNTRDTYELLKEGIIDDKKCYRWNPKLSFNCMLEDVPKIKQLKKDTIAYLESENVAVEFSKFCNNLIAQMFYCQKGAFEENTLNGCIKSRVQLSQELSDQLEILGTNAFKILSGLDQVSVEWGKMNLSSDWLSLPFKVVGICHGLSLSVVCEVTGNVQVQTEFEIAGSPVLCE